MDNKLRELERITSKYPSIKDNNFYDKIEKTFNKFKIPKKKETANKYCKAKEFKLQQPQEFLSKYINPNTPYKSVLVYHRIGAGKTCTAIQICEKWKKERKIIFVLPASLKGNLRNELRSQCGGNEYLSKSDRKILEKLDPKDEKFKEIIRKSNSKIEKYYNILSYNKFIDLASNNKISLRNSVLVIDEIQNMVSEKGTYYKELYNLLSRSSSNLRLVLLSATPMFDKPNEIALTMNLLDSNINMPIGREFTKTFIQEKSRNNNIYYSVKNMDLFKNMIKGYVSYYRGAPKSTFPEMKIKYVELEMSDFQYDVYKKVLRDEEIKSKSKFKVKLSDEGEKIISASELPNNFFIGTRIISNIVYPNKKISEYGLKSLTKYEILENLEKYSIKFYSIMKKIKQKGKIFIYSSFKEHGGLKSMVKVLNAYGYKNYSKYGIGKKRYAVWSGDEKNDLKDQIREVFNKKENLYGDNLKIILGSPSIKEGVSLKAVKQVHILEPYWNKSRLDQVIGRASRFCSHILLPEDERKVKVYVYICKREGIKTVDQYIRKLSSNKNKLISKFEKALKEASIDCRLNIHANQDDKDELICN